MGWSDELEADLLMGVRSMNKLDYAMEKLSDNGFKLTNKRHKMLNILMQEDRYLSAKDVQEKMLEHFRGISPDTIYRNLYTFVDLGLVEVTELEGERIFRFSCDLHDDHHHHHFICTDCGNTKELEDCPMSYFSGQLPNCEIKSHRFEIFGLCENCSHH